MPASKTRTLTMTVATALLLAGCSSGADTDTSSAMTPSSSARPAQQQMPETNSRGEAAMPERIADANYQYAQALMQLPTDQLEKTYMGEIIPHHQAVIDMAKIALEKAEHPSLKTLSRAIIASQTQQIEGFTMLLETEYGVTPEQARQQAPVQIREILDEVNQGLEEKVATVRDAPAGPQFDQTWLKEVIPHHQVAILESQAVQVGAKLPQLVLMADMAIGGQEMQIVQMLNWLVQWYGTP